MKAGNNTYSGTRRKWQIGVKQEMINRMEK